MWHPFKKQRSWQEQLLDYTRAYNAAGSPLHPQYHEVMRLAMKQLHEKYNNHPGMHWTDDDLEYLSWLSVEARRKN